MTSIQYLNPALRELNARLRSAFAQADQLSSEQVRDCRWYAMGMLPAIVDATTHQQMLADELKAVAHFARSRGIEGVAGWCMAACQYRNAEGSMSDIRPSIRDFIFAHVPAPAHIIDVAAGTGSQSLPLAAQGYRVSLFEPSCAFLAAAQDNATTQGVEDSVAELICGSFSDLSKIETDAYDVSICLGSVFYAHPKQAAEDALSNLARIATRAVVVDVASKYGMILALSAEGNLSGESINQILSTGIHSPPVNIKNGNVVYSCFSSTGLCDTLGRFGLRVEHLVGYGDSGTLDQATAELLPTSERSQIEEYLQAEETLVDLYPNMLALCVKERP